MMSGFLRKILPLAGVIDRLTPRSSGVATDDAGRGSGTQMSAQDPRRGQPGRGRPSVTGAAAVTREDHRTAGMGSRDRKGEGVAVSVVWRRKLRESMDRLFVSREIFLRANGQVRFIRLSPGLQKSVAVALFAVSAWLTYASTSYVLHGFILEEKRQEIEH